MRKEIVILAILHLLVVSAQNIICTTQLCTWWHDSGEINTKTRVEPGNVRQSHVYLVQVGIKSDFPPSFHDSFVYETIPRNGNGKIYSPWDDPSSDTFTGDDGISVEIDLGVTMAWTQFEYNDDVMVKILRRDGLPLSDLIIRPVDPAYEFHYSEDGGVILEIPNDKNGRRISIEFQDQIYTYRSDGNQYVRDSNSPAVGEEPIHSLLIFASPFLSEDVIPPLDSPDTHVMKPGPINNNDWGTSAILYFPPGVYWMNQAVSSGDSPKYGESHIKLHSNTKWVYFAPGSYVKGAIEYTINEEGGAFYATGHGVLSGEHYVYQANPTSSYQAVKSDQYSLRMWGHYNVTSQQKWYCIGPTINSAPFNSMDFFGKSEEISVEIQDYKQVGSFFYQTDGPQIYPNSHVHHVFYHVNDDGIKTYHSNVTIHDVIIWKVNNDPIIQMGWDIRDVQNITIENLSILHTRYYQQLNPNEVNDVPSAIFGASPFYNPTGQVIQPSKRLQLTAQNITCEGYYCPALFQIQPLQSYEMLIENVIYRDGLQSNDLFIGQSVIPAASNIVMNLTIRNWLIGKEQVNMNNFQSDSLGQFNIDASYWGQWEIL